MENTCQKGTSEGEYNCDIEKYLVKIFSYVVLECFFKTGRMEKIGEK